MGQTLCLSWAPAVVHLFHLQLYCGLRCSGLLNHTCSSAPADEATAAECRLSHFIKIQLESFADVGPISWTRSAELCSVVRSLFSLLFVCLTVPQ